MENSSSEINTIKREKLYKKKKTEKKRKRPAQQGRTQLSNKSSRKINQIPLNAHANPMNHLLEILSNKQNIIQLKLSTRFKIHKHAIILKETEKENVLSSTETLVQESIQRKIMTCLTKEKHNAARSLW